MFRSLVGIASGLYDAIFRPGEFVAARTTRTGGSIRAQLGQIRSLFVVYMINLITYAGPLTLAGFGRQHVPSMPVWFRELVPAGDPVRVWVLGYAFVQNSLFLLSATLLTLFAVHGAVLLTLQSNGVVRTAYSVVYSTSAYLAGIFTVVWWLSTADGVEAARTFIANVQREFVYVVIDWLGVDVGLPGGRPETLDPGGFSQTGTYLLAILGILIGYYLYSLYVGTRVNHEADRIISAVVVAAVMVSPVFYVAASILAVTNQPVPIL